MDYDIVVAGAGPVGLCFARSLAGSGLRVALVERQDEASLARPADDGREIALTHRSARLLRELGLWRHLREDEIGVLRDAQVLDGEGGEVLRFSHRDGGKAQLGWLVPHYAIRRAAYAEASGLAGVALLAGRGVEAAQPGADGVQVTLAGGERLRASLLVAADSRFSALRRGAGIAADLHDFGKLMLVLRMRHEVPHAQTAWEWFGHGQTLALLPLRDPHVSSVVLTLAPAAMQALLALDDAALAAAMARRFGGRLGAMQVAGPRCAYPLVGVYARRFVGERFALLGDAAVGMHPLTAHGFNFGLAGQARLARGLRDALAAGRPFWSGEALAGYERAHRLATWPLYRATQLLAGLYTDDRAPARAVRALALGAAARLRPFRRLVAGDLAADGGVAGRCPAWLLHGPRLRPATR